MRLWSRSVSVNVADVRLFEPLPRQIFRSTVEHDLILEFTKEMFTMKQFEQVSSLLLKYLHVIKSYRL